MTFLAQANTPEEFRKSLVGALNESSPLDRNKAIALANHFKPESKKTLLLSDKVKKQVFGIVSKVFPGAYCVYGRKKDFLSYSQKLSDKLNVEDIKDIYALRVILSDQVINKEDTIAFSYRVLKALIDGLQDLSYTIDVPLTNADKEKKSKTEKPSSEILKQIIVPKELDPALSQYVAVFKNYVMFPKSNGYQGLHIIIKTPEGIYIEIQVRTLTQHIWAERGPASHDVNYKAGTEIDKLVAERGEEFIKVLATPTVIGQPLFRNTFRETFPDTEL